MKKEEIKIEESKIYFRIVENTLKDGKKQYDAQYGLMMPNNEVHYYSTNKTYESYDEALKVIEEYKQNQVVKRVATYLD